MYYSTNGCMNLVEVIITLGKNYWVIINNWISQYEQEKMCVMLIVVITFK